MYVLISVNHQICFPPKPLAHFFSKKNDPFDGASVASKAYNFNFNHFQAGFPPRLITQFPSSMDD